RALGRVDQQHHTVDHRQRTLDLTAEVGVAGGVDDVDHRDRTVRVVPVHRGVLGQDGDALLPLQVAGVHHPVYRLGTFGEGAGLPEHRVDQGGLAVVDVGDDGDVAKIGARRAHERGYSSSVGSADGRSTVRAYVPEPPEAASWP